MVEAPRAVSGPLFTDEELLTLASVGHVIRRAAGDPFFMEGEQTDFALFLQKGHVKCVAGRPPRTVAIRHAGDMVGEMAAILGEPRSASIIALDEVVALFLSAGRWLQFLYEHPRAMHMQLIESERRVSQATRKIIESDLAVEQRLAKALVELVDSGFGDRADVGFGLRLSQQDIAALVGASKLDSVKKVIRIFKERDIVRTGRQMMVIHDLAALRDIARGDTTASL